MNSSSFQTPAQVHSSSSDRSSVCRSYSAQTRSEGRMICQMSEEQHWRFLSLLEELVGLMRSYRYLAYYLSFIATLALILEISWPS